MILLLLLNTDFDAAAAALTKVMTAWGLSLAAE
jgi:hypothetical protein